MNCVAQLRGSPESFRTWLKGGGGLGAKKARKEKKEGCCKDGVSVVLQGSFHVALQATNKSRERTHSGNCCPIRSALRSPCSCLGCEGASLLEQAGDCERLRLQKLWRAVKKRNSFCHPPSINPRKPVSKCARGLWKSNVQHVAPLIKSWKVKS